MTTVNFTPDEVQALLDGFNEMARFFRVEVIDVCDAYAALIGQVIALQRADEPFTPEQRRQSIETLQRSAESIARTRQKLAHSADQLTALAELIEQRRNAAER